MKLDYEIVTPEDEKPFIVIFEAEYEDASKPWHRGIAGEGQRVDTAMRNASRNLKQMADRLWAESFSDNH
jgi:hypothetical protein